MQKATGLASALALSAFAVLGVGSAMACERNCDCNTGYVSHHHRYVWPGDAPRVVVAPPVYYAPPVVYVHPAPVHHVERYYVPAPRAYYSVRPAHHHHHW